MKTKWKHLHCTCPCHTNKGCSCTAKLSLRQTNGGGSNTITTKRHPEFSLTLQLKPPLKHLKSWATDSQQWLHSNFSWLLRGGRGTHIRGPPTQRSLERGGTGPSAPLLLQPERRKPQHRCSCSLTRIWKFFQIQCPKVFLVCLYLLEKWKHQY